MGDYYFYRFQLLYLGSIYGHGRESNRVVASSGFVIGASFGVIII